MFCRLRNCSLWNTSKAAASQKSFLFVGRRQRLPLDFVSCRLPSFRLSFCAKTNHFAAFDPAVRLFRNGTIAFTFTCFCAFGFFESCYPGNFIAKFFLIALSQSYFTQPSVVLFALKFNLHTRWDLHAIYVHRAKHYKSFGFVPSFCHTNGSWSGRFCRDMSWGVLRL